MSEALDSKFTAEGFRKNFPLILATNRQHATVIGARLAAQAAALLPGQLLARNSTSGLYDVYASGGSSGLDTAKGILLIDADVSATSQVVQILMGGEVYKDNIVGYDSDTPADLNGRVYINGANENIFKF
jgi:hypothetical protein